MRLLQAQRLVGGALLERAQRERGLLVASDCGYVGLYTRGARVVLVSNDRRGMDNMGGVSIWEHDAPVLRLERPGFACMARGSSVWALVPQGLIRLDAPQPTLHLIEKKASAAR